MRVLPTCRSVGDSLFIIIAIEESLYSPKTFSIKPHLQSTVFAMISTPNVKNSPMLEKIGATNSSRENVQNEYLTIYQAHMLIYLNKQFDKCPAWMIYIHILIYMCMVNDWGKKHSTATMQLSVTKLYTFSLTLRLLSPLHP